MLIPPVLKYSAAMRYEFQSRRPQEAHSVMAGFFEPQFRLNVGNRARFDFRLRHFRCGAGVTISRLAFNAEVRVEIDRLDAYMVQMPLAGRNELRVHGMRGGRLSLDRGLSSVIGPERGLEQRRSPDCDMLLVRFNAAELARCVAAHVGDGAMSGNPSDLDFDLEMPMRERASAAWRRLVAYVLGELDRENSLFASTLAASQAGHLLMSALVLHHPHRYSALLRRSAREDSPRFKRAADDFLQAHAEEPITGDDVARHLGVSTRSVYAGFRRHFGMTPIQRLKDIRFARVREDLVAARSDSVTAIALHWGFTHLGKFAADYHRRFGELPSETLRSAKRRDSPRLG